MPWIMGDVLLGGLGDLVVGRRTALLIGASAVAALGELAYRPGLYVLGDSWAAGLHADPANALGQVAAARLGWGVRVNAVSGTGYLNTAGGAGSYPQRALEVPRGNSEAVVVLQGGSNDDGQVHADIPGAVRQTVRRIADRFPHGRIVLLGPGPDPAPVTAQQADVDLVLQRTAAGLGLPYVSMLQQQWIPATGSSWIIDDANHHPTVAGQRYLGARLAGALKRLYPDLAR